MHLGRKKTHKDLKPTTCNSDLWERSGCQGGLSFYAYCFCLFKKENCLSSTNKNTWKEIKKEWRKERWPAGNSHFQGGEGGCLSLRLLPEPHCVNSFVTIKLTVMASIDWILIYNAPIAKISKRTYAEMIIIKYSVLENYE